MYRFLFIAIVVMFTWNMAFAAALKDEAEIRKFADDVMKSVAANDLKAATEKMKNYAPLPPAELDNIHLTISTERAKTEGRMGKAYGYEYISIKKVGASLLRLQYLEKLKETGLMWQFYFYKTEEGWVMEGMNCAPMKGLFATN